MNPERFQLCITLGNEAMQSPEDVARILTEVSRQLVEESADNRKVYDDNGNSCGSWWFE